MKSLVVDINAAADTSTDRRDAVRVEPHDIEARAGECRIALGLAGICGTDLQILEGYAGFSGIPGH